MRFQSVTVNACGFWKAQSAAVMQCGWVEEDCDDMWRWEGGVGASWVRLCIQRRFGKREVRGGLTNQHLEGEEVDGAPLLERFPSDRNHGRQYVVVFPVNSFLDGRPAFVVSKLSRSLLLGCHLSACDEATSVPFGQAYTSEIYSEGSVFLLVLFGTIFSKKDSNTCTGALVRHIETRQSEAPGPYPHRVANCAGDKIVACDIPDVLPMGTCDMRLEQKAVPLRWLSTPDATFNKSLVRVPPLIPLSSPSCQLFPTLICRADSAKSGLLLSFASQTGAPLRTSFVRSISPMSS